MYMCIDIGIVNMSGDCTVLILLVWTQVMDKLQVP